MITSQKATWTIEKTKQIPSIGTNGQYYVLPQEGMIDRNRELLDIAIEMSIIERRGAWFFYGDQKWNGMGKIELTEQQFEEISAKILG